MTEAHVTPVALTIAGSDCSGGAGIQADLKTFTGLGVYGASVLTALTAQNTTGVQAIHAVPPEFICAQFDSVFSDLDVTACKIGMLGTRAAIEAVSDGLERHHTPWLVVDPVMVATSGDVLLEPDAEEALRALIIPKASIITPNIHEAARLLHQQPAADEADLRRQAEALIAAGARSVLIKGGHGNGEEATDVYHDGSEMVTLRAMRIDTANTHGTGCTLSAAIAAGLAAGLPMHEAVSEAKAFVTDAIRGGAALRVGHGNGPLDHVVAMRARMTGGFDVPSGVRKE